MRHEVPDVGQEVQFVGVSASRTTQGFTNFHFKYLTVFGGEYHWHILSPHRFPGFDPSGVWAPVVVAIPELQLPVVLLAQIQQQARER